MYVGDDGNLLEERAENCRVLQIHNPILTSVDMLKIKHMDRPGFRVETVSLLYFKNMPLKRALDQMKLSADRAYRGGANIIILSDRGVDENPAGPGGPAPPGEYPPPWRRWVPPPFGPWAGWRP